MNCPKYNMFIFNSNRSHWTCFPNTHQFPHPPSPAISPRSRRGLERRWKSEEAENPHLQKWLIPTSFSSLHGSFHHIWWSCSSNVILFLEFLPQFFTIFPTNRSWTCCPPRSWPRSRQRRTRPRQGRRKPYLWKRLVSRLMISYHESKRGWKTLWRYPQSCPWIENRSWTTQLLVIKLVHSLLLLEISVATLQNHNGVHGKFAVVRMFHLQWELSRSWRSFEALQKAPQEVV